MPGDVTDKYQLPTMAIGRKTAAWLPPTKQYVLADPGFAEIAVRIVNGERPGQVIKYCSDFLGLPPDDAAGLESEARRLLNEKTNDNPGLSSATADKVFGSDGTPPEFFSERYYRIGEKTFQIFYPGERAESLLHPKYSHCESTRPESFDHCFRLHYRQGYYALEIDGVRAGIWHKRKEHVVCGQFSMNLAGRIYGKANSEWMAVLHAACVAGPQGGIIFAGDSGAGKSTLAALIYSRGFDVMADDFLPVDSATGRAYRFPGALSVKEKSVELLAGHFPQLKRAEKYKYSQQKVHVRYLPLDRRDTDVVSTECREIVFVEYDENTPLQFEKMPPEEAFARLIPDTWVHPSHKNAGRFLEWFVSLEFYRLIYSDEEAMTDTVKRLLEGDNESL